MSRRWFAPWWALIAALMLGVAAGPAAAHEISMAELQVMETTPGDFTWQWMAGEKRPPGDELSPVWPEGCRAEGNVVHCGAQGFKGTLSVDGVGRGFSAALVRVTWADGSTRVFTITKGQTSVQVYGAAEDNRGLGEVARAYTVLGVEHILSGVDHLLFVIGLLFLVGFRRRLLWTITAFTAAHSLTLASSALGWLTLRSPPVEATIALSIVLVAGEALHSRETLARRWPALVAFLFGLVHGLGFAGALAAIGLPEKHMLMALLTFNVGVELGQLMTVAACAALAWAWQRLALAQRLPQARTAALYGIGTVAAYWSVERVAAILA